MVLSVEGKFRLATIEDSTALAALDASVTPTAWGVNNFQDSLNSDDRCWLLEREGELLASSVYSVVLDEASLLNITVRPSSQGRGLGRYMLEYLLAEAYDDGARVCFLEVRQSNEAAIALYLQSGFLQVGLRKNYYLLKGRREHALVMKRELSGNVS